MFLGELKVSQTTNRTDSVHVYNSTLRVYIFYFLPINQYCVDEHLRTMTVYAGQVTSTAILRTIFFGVFPVEQFIDDGQTPARLQWHGTVRALGHHFRYWFSPVRHHQRWHVHWRGRRLHQNHVRLRHHGHLSSGAVSRRAVKPPDRTVSESEQSSRTLGGRLVNWKCVDLWSYIYKNDKMVLLRVYITLAELDWGPKPPWSKQLLPCSSTKI